MNCRICDVGLCLHGMTLIKGNTVTCLRCNMSPPESYCLPFYEGKVNFESHVSSPVCKACSILYGESSIEEWRKNEIMVR